MLRISTHEEPDATTLKLEGKVIGPWVEELDRAWRLAAAALGSRRLVVDLSGVTQMCAGGRQVLADIHHGTSARFIADNPMTKYFAEQAQLETLRDSKEKT